MVNTVFFGNGLNRISENSVTWDDLLDKMKAGNQFAHQSLPNTMVYERIFMERHKAGASEKADELELKNQIAFEMRSQGSNELFELLASMPFENYITTNYDYAFEEAIKIPAIPLSNEDVYSLRRKRAYQTNSGQKYLWNIHGEIDHPKSIMLGLDHYCGSVSKLDSYIKGSYKHKVDGVSKSVTDMRHKLETNEYCYTSWIDLFFSTDVHIIGFSLDYSETDIWWLLNKRARFSTEELVKNRVYFYGSNINSEMKELLKAFHVEVKEFVVTGDDYKDMYQSMIQSMPVTDKSVIAA